MRLSDVVPMISRSENPMGRFLRSMIAAALLCLAHEYIAAQTLSVVGVDTTAFPVVRARLFVYGADGRPNIDLNVGDFSVAEAGVARDVVEFSCPDPRLPDPISSVLTIDVSGSMTGGRSGEPNIRIAQAAARAWVDALAPGLSECAITSFDHESYLNLDFTRDRSRLRSAIDALVPQGGTSYNAGLLTPPTGGLAVAVRGAYKRVVVFLTDGQGEGVESAIVAAAQGGNTTVYCVTLGMPMPDLLKNIATKTGGAWFENVTSAAQAQDIYRTILQLAQGGSPCLLSWKSDTSCMNDRTATITVPRLGLSSTVTYLMPWSARPTLTIEPSSLAFGPVPPGATGDLIVTIGAPDRAVRVRSIVSSDPRFTIESGGAPPEFTLNPGETRELKIRFAPVDSTLSFAVIDILSDACVTPALVVSGGYPGKRPSLPTLRVTAPNGGERLTAGEDAVLSWYGVLPADTVRLEYSVDGGATWLPVTDGAIGLRTVWNAPRTPSERCLLRVAQMPDDDDRMTIDGFTGGINAVNFSADGRYVVTADDNGKATIWDVAAKIVARTFQGHTGSVSNALFSDDGSMILTTSDDGEAKVWNAATGALISVLVGHVGGVVSGDFSPDGGRVATVSYDGNVIIWNAATGAMQENFGPTGYSSVRFSPDGARVIVSEPFNQRATIWDIASGSSLLALQGHAGPVFDAVYAPDGSRAVTASGDRTAKIWNTTDGTVLATLTGHEGIVLAADVRFDGRVAVTGATDGTVRLWDVSGGGLLRTIALGRSVRSVRFDVDGDRLFVGLDTLAVIIDLRPMQEDVSDSLWAIVVPSFAGADVDLGRVSVGSVKDSVVVAYICNTGSVPATVRDLRFAGGNADEFSLVSGLPPFVLAPGECVSVEFRFAPVAPGPRSAAIEMIAGGDTLRYIIRGEGVESALRLTDSFVDFGEVVIGAWRDSLVTLTVVNTGVLPVSVVETAMIGPDMTQFAVVNGGGAFTLAPGASRILHLRFSPQLLGGASARVLLRTSDAALSTAIGLFGTGICGGDAEYLAAIIPPNLAALIGDTVTIPLLLGTSGGAAIAPAEFAVTLRFNKSLLLPLDSVGAVAVDGDDLLLAFNGRSRSGNDTLIAVRCIVALGNAESTPLIIEEFAWRGCAASFTTSDGSLKALDLCREGEPRLFLADGHVGLKPVRPNPAAGVVEIEYEIIEPGAARLSVTDMLGGEVARAVDGAVQPGLHTARLDLSALPDGLYFCILHTSTQRFMRPLRVAR